MRAAHTPVRYSRSRLLDTGWSICSTPAGACSEPGGLERAKPQWIAIPRLASAAAALREVGKWSLDGPPVRFDAMDWWYRLTFDAGHREAKDCLLGFDGLATASEVWLDDALVLRSDSMFLRHRLELAGLLPGAHELLIRFRSLDELLALRRPRPRWRTPMVENQQLRWWRTSLLGRTPGWSPPAAVVGPWRGIWLAEKNCDPVSEVTLQAIVEDRDGLLDVTARLTNVPGTGVTIRARAADQEYVTQCVPNPDGRIHCRLRLPKVRFWWPHTHGEPALYHVTLEADGAPRVVLGQVGFRTINVDTQDGDFRFVINGVNLFCRGACWTPIDSTSLTATVTEYERALAQVRDSGMNMVRVTGTLAYESKDFFAVCDRLGILVWQDFMFANMDYPDHDEAFLDLVRAEVEQVLSDVRHHPSVAILCGNSEVEQQAAMWGVSRDLWQPVLFHEFIPAIISAAAPAIAYWPSSAHGGAFPHDPGQGTTSYYGVGAYRRDLADARRGAPRFATECLALANVPDQAALSLLSANGGIRVHQPIWRSRSPRDLGAGWDFDDVRDHYLAALFGVDVASLRYADHERYLDLSRATSGEVMAQVFSEWRTGASRCRGALVLFQKDLWLGAGWGLIDARGQPKAPWYYLRRVLQPVALILTDEGTGGLAIHVINDRAEVFEGKVLLQLFRDGRVAVARGTLDVTVAPHSAVRLSAAAAFDVGHDVTYAYRFGPAGHDALVATLADAKAMVVAEASYFPPTTKLPDVDGVELKVGAKSDGRCTALELSSERFLRCVALDIDGFQPEDNYFDLAPGRVRRIALTEIESRARLSGTIGAINFRRRKAFSSDLATG